MNLARRLQSYGHARQRQAHRQAVSVAAAADRAILITWRDFFAWLAHGQTWFAAHSMAQTLFGGLLSHVHIAIAQRLRVVSDWSWRSAVHVLRRSVPKETLHRAVRLDLREDEGASVAIQLTDLIDLLFPPPSPSEVHHVIFGGDWRERLTSLSRLAPPWELAGIVGAGLAAGKDHREIARELRPYVDNVRSSARRIARTEALRVAGAMQMKCHEQLGDLVIGYTVYSGHLPSSRSWHVQRSGTSYYKRPKAGQKGLDKMPRPPDEAPDPSERPPGTPATAPNCVCYLVPLLQD